MAGPKAMGLIEGVAEATASLLKLFSGVIVDRTRRAQPWIIFGYGLAGLGRPLIALVSSWPALLMIRFADRVGKGLRSSPRDALLAATEGVEKALVADLAPDGQEGTAFGWFHLVTGALLLPASTFFGWLYQTFQPRTAFFFSGGCALTAALLLLVWVQPKIMPSLDSQ